MKLKTHFAAYGRVFFLFSETNKFIPPPFNRLYIESPAHTHARVYSSLHLAFCPDNSQILELPSATFVKTKDVLENITEEQTIPMRKAKLSFIIKIRRT